MGCWQGRDILTLMVRMKKLSVVEKRLPMATLLTSHSNAECEEDCPILKEVNRGISKAVVLYRLDDMPLLVDAFAKNSKDVGETLSLLRKLIME